MLPTLVVTLFCAVCMSGRAYALGEDHFYLQLAVNTRTWTIEGAVVMDTISPTGHGIEADRISSDTLGILGHRNQVGITAHDLNSIGENIPVQTTWDTSGTGGLVMTFPGYANAMNLGDSSAGAADELRANAARDALIADLNEAIEMAYPSRSGWTMSVFKSRMTTLLGGLSGLFGSSPQASVTIGSASFSLLPSFSPDTLPVGFDKTSLPWDYFVVTSTTTGKTTYLCWNFLKGYESETDRTTFSAYFTGRASVSGLRHSETYSDTFFISWDAILYEAIVNSCLVSESAVTESNVTDSPPGQLEQSVTSFFGNLVRTLRNILGLWSLDQLVFNNGTRGTDSYVCGIFPSDWENTIWAFFVMSELLALVFLMYGVISNIIRRAAATTNSMDKRKVWDQVKDIIVVAVVLAVLPLLLRVLMELSCNMTGIIRGATTNQSIDGLRDGLAKSSGTMGGVIVNIMYLGIDVYYNFFYLLRSLTVTFLIIVSPICIVATTFDNKSKAMLDGWVKEFFANIFIQPIHALIFSVILLVPASSHHFDNIIMVYATIPMTGLVRGMLFGNAGGLGDRLAGAGRKRVMATMGGVAGAGIGALGSGIASRISSQVKSSKASGEEASGGAGENLGGGGEESRDYDTASVMPDKSKAITTPDDGGAASGGGKTDGGSAVGSGGGGGNDGDGNGNAGNEMDGGHESNKDFLVNAFEAAADKRSFGEKASDLYQNTKQSASDAYQGAKQSASNMYQDLNASPAGRHALYAGKALAGAAVVGGAAMLSGFGGGLKANGIDLGQPFHKATQQMARKGGAIIGSRLPKNQQEEPKLEEPPVNAEGLAVPDGAKTPDAPIDNSCSVADMEPTDGVEPMSDEEASLVFDDGEDLAEEDSDPTWFGETSTFKNRTEVSIRGRDAGLKNVSDDGDQITFKTKNGQFGAYSDITSKMPREQADALRQSTGVTVTPVMSKGGPTGEYAVSIDKAAFKSGTGTDISAKNGYINLAGGDSPSIVPSIPVSRADATGTVSRSVTPKTAQRVVNTGGDMRIGSNGTPAPKTTLQPAKEETPASDFAGGEDEMPDLTEIDQASSQAEFQAELNAGRAEAETNGVF